MFSSANHRTELARPAGRQLRRENAEIKWKDLESLGRFVGKKDLGAGCPPRFSSTCRTLDDPTPSNQSKGKKEAHLQKVIAPAEAPEIQSVPP